MRKIEINVYSIKDDGCPKEGVAVCRNIISGCICEWKITNNIHNILKSPETTDYWNNIYFSTNEYNAYYKYTDEAMAYIKPIPCWYCTFEDVDEYGDSTFDLCIKPVEDDDKYIIIDDLNGVEETLEMMNGKKMEVSK